MPAREGIKLESAIKVEIRVQGHVAQTVSERIGSTAVWSEDAVSAAPMTVLTGEFVDQAALAGALNYLFDLGFPLLSVVCEASAG